MSRLLHSLIPFLAVKPVTAISVFQPSPLFPSENVLVGSKRDQKSKVPREGVDKGAGEWDTN